MVWCGWFVACEKKSVVVRHCSCNMDFKNKSVKRVAWLQQTLRSTFAAVAMLRPNMHI